MSKPDHPKKFPKIISMPGEVAIALRKYRGKRIKTQEVQPGVLVEFDKKGNPIGVIIKR